jgi:hypothetical protein
VRPVGVTRRGRVLCQAATTVTKTVKIGTRGSPLALAQAYMTRDLLKVSAARGNGAPPPSMRAAVAGGLTGCAQRCISSSWGAPAAVIANSASHVQQQQQQ